MILLVVVSYYCSNFFYILFLNFLLLPSDIYLNKKLFEIITVTLFTKMSNKNMHKLLSWTDVRTCIELQYETHSWPFFKLHHARWICCQLLSSRTVLCIFVSLEFIEWINKLFILHNKYVIVLQAFKKLRSYLLAYTNTCVRAMTGDHELIFYNSLTV